MKIATLFLAVACMIRADAAAISKDDDLDTAESSYKKPHIIILPAPVPVAAPIAVPAPVPVAAPIAVPAPIHVAPVPTPVVIPSISGGCGGSICGSPDFGPPLGPIVIRLIEQDYGGGCGGSVCGTSGFAPGPTPVIGPSYGGGCGGSICGPPPTIVNVVHAEPQFAGPVGYPSQPPILVKVIESQSHVPPPPIIVHVQEQPPCSFGVVGIGCG